MLKSPRLHRFPPLAQLGAGRPATPQAAAALQASLAQGFQQGLARGYEEGHASGLQAGAEEARAQGRAEGQAQGQREMAERFEALAAPVEALRAQWQQLVDDYQTAMRREVVELVERVARQVIRCELTLQPAQLLALVDETLAAMPAGGAAPEVFMNPEDLGRLRDFAADRAQAWQLRADAQLASGEVRVLSGGLEADAGCAQRLTACMAQVSEQLNHPHAGGQP